MAATVILPLLLLGYASWQHYVALSRSADERIAHSLDLALEHAERVFQSIEVLFSGVEEITRGRTDASIELYEAQLSERLKEMVGSIPDLRAIWLFGLDGKPLVTSSVYPAPDLNNSDRDYFIAQRDPAMGTYVGQILIPKIGGEQFFTVSRKRRDSSGEVAGISAVVVPPHLFEHLFETLADKSSASFGLIRQDGVVLARYPQPVQPGLVLGEGSGFRRAIAEGTNAASYTGVSAVDGLERRFLVRRMSRLPLYATSSLETAAIWSDWRQWNVLQLSLWTPIVLLVLWLEYVALRRTRQFHAEVVRRESAEAALRQSQKMEALGQLTGGIAHDFNNLLSIVIGSLEMVAGQFAEGSKVHRRVSNAMNGAQRAAQLVRRLLAFARRQPLDPRPVDANELVLRTAELLGRSLGEHITIDVVEAPDLWLTEADPIELESAIINLAVNARDAMPAGGRLTIRAANAVLDAAYCNARENELVPGDYVAISVIDQGRGIAPDLVDRVFEPFFTTKDAGLGTGLGLSQVYGFVKQSGGHVVIESEPGRGTTVVMYLPRSYSTGLQHGPDLEGEANGGEGEVILVVEDDKGVREYLQETLTEMGYTVIAPVSAQAALELIGDARIRIDLLLTDVIMPSMDGRQLAERASAKRPAMRVLYMTGYSRDTMVHNGRLDPGVALIQKPVSRQELAIRIRNLLAAAPPAVVT